MRTHVQTIAFRGDGKPLHRSRTGIGYTLQLSIRQRKALTRGCGPHQMHLIGRDAPGDDRGPQPLHDPVLIPVFDCDHKGESVIDDFDVNDEFNGPDSVSPTDQLGIVQA